MIYGRFFESRARESRQKLLIVACAKIGEFFDGKYFSRCFKRFKRNRWINRFDCPPTSDSKDEERNHEKICQPLCDIETWESHDSLGRASRVFFRFDFSKIDWETKKNENSSLSRPREHKIAGGGEIKCSTNMTIKQTIRFGFSFLVSKATTNSVFSWMTLFPFRFPLRAPANEAQKDWWSGITLLRSMSWNLKWMECFKWLHWFAILP